MIILPFGADCVDHLDTGLILNAGRRGAISENSGSAVDRIFDSESIDPANEAGVSSSYSDSPFSASSICLLKRSSISRRREDSRLFSMENICASADRGLARPV